MKLKIPADLAASWDLVASCAIEIAPGCNPFNLRESTDLERRSLAGGVPGSSAEAAKDHQLRAFAGRSLADFTCRRGLLGAFPCGPRFDQSDRFGRSVAGISSCEP